MPRFLHSGLSGNGLMAVDLSGCTASGSMIMCPVDELCGHDYGHPHFLFTGVWNGRLPVEAKG